MLVALSLDPRIQHDRLNVRKVATSQRQLMAHPGRMRNVRFGFRIGMELPIGTTGVILSRWEHAGGVRLAITLEGVPRFGFASGIRVEEVEVLPAG